MKLWPESKPGDRLKISAPTDHAARFMADRFTTEPDGSRWTNLLAVHRHDGWTDIYAARER